MTNISIGLLFSDVVTHFHTIMIIVAIIAAACIATMHLHLYFHKLHPSCWSDYLFKIHVHIFAGEKG